MSLDVTVYTIGDDGKRQTVRSIDWKSIMASWRVRKLSKEDHQRELHQLLKDSETWRTVAGPEVWRTEVYGSPTAKALGLTLLPSLAHRNLDVQGTELDRLAWEIETLSRNVDLFDVITPLIVASASRTQSEEMLLRFQNIANAAAEAKQLNGASRSSRALSCD